MSSHPSESDLIAVLDRGDELVRLCAAGRISFGDFLAKYDNLYWFHALDGHESDQLGQDVLAKYAARIAPHQAVAETVLAKACPDADAALDSFHSAGRIGSIEAVARLRLVAAGLPGGEA